MDRFIICRASAGSGKTYTLVRQFIETSISSPSDVAHRFEHILAITFTNKAANGMKQRIMSQLHDITTGSPKSDFLVQEMAEHLDISKEEVTARCVILQTTILHSYSNFSVCTIDSFVHRLVRTFAYDLRLPMNFNVQIDDQEMLQWTVDELLACAGKDGEETLTRVLCDFVETRMEDGSGYKLEKKLTELAQQILREETPAFLACLDEMKMEDYVRAFHKLRDDNRIFEEKMAQTARIFTDACDAEGLRVDDFPNKKTGVLPFFERLSRGDFSKINNEHKRVDTAAETGVLFAKSTPVDIKEKLETVTPAFMHSYALLDDLLEEELPRYNTRNLLLPNIFGLALLGRVNALKNSYYADNDTVHISEFNKRIANEIANEPAPFIYERIGSRYSNYMIDEFQDTSRLQWLNFLPLLDEAMSRRVPGDTALPGMQSLVVGDGKQAIYRFRQGDVRQFMKLPEVDSHTHGASLKPNAKVVNLDRNFRTLSNIVEFNNRFFTFVVSQRFGDNEVLRGLYLGNGGTECPDLRQKPVKQGGYVEVSFLFKEEICQRIHYAIRHQVDDLGYSYGDIMILARDKKTLVAVAEYLTENSTDRPIPLVSAESFILNNSHIVMLLYALLRCLHNPQDHVAAVDVVEEMYHAGLLGDESGGLDEALWLLQSVAFDLSKFLLAEGVNMNYDYLRGLSLYDCCEQLLRIFHLQGRDTAYVASLLNVVDNYQSRGSAGLSGLLDYLDARLPELSYSTASDMDAVQLMTIHKAKGLEGKIVICAMPAEPGHPSALWVNVPDNEDMALPVAFVNSKKERTLFDTVFDEERRLAEMDRINILYVALTRPEEKLLIFGENKFSTERKDNMALLYDFVRQDGECEQLDDITFSIGEDTAKAAGQGGVVEKHLALVDTPLSETNIAVDNAVFPSWQDRIGIASQSGALLSSVMTDSRRYGILVHEVLSLIRYREEMESVVTDYCRQKGLDDDVKEAVEARIAQMMNQEKNRVFFDRRHEVAREVSLVYEGATLRPDRVVFGDDTTWVVDFKTGTYDEKRHNQYLNQVDTYCQAIAAMGYPNVSPVIIYL